MTPDVATILDRLKAIREDAPCEGCGASLSSCKKMRGKDPTAPPWFGCCATGMGLAPCVHTLSGISFNTLIKEIESGDLRSMEDLLVDSLNESLGVSMGSLQRAGRQLTEDLCHDLGILRHYTREDRHDDE